MKKPEESHDMLKLRAALFEQAFLLAYSRVSPGQPACVEQAFAAALSNVSPATPERGKCGCGLVMPTDSPK